MSTLDHSTAISISTSKKERIQQVREQRDTSIAKVQPTITAFAERLSSNVTTVPGKILTDDEISITEKPVRELLDLEALDKYFTGHKQPIGPLPGLPVSTKEHIYMKGWESNFSYVVRVGAIARTSSAVLETLHDTGAIFFTRTTQPQILMAMDTSSELYGNHGQSI
ncbi:hypothetical protein FOPE_01053 [Fonsecaea pedrosoi]|nr:hypothetical protein FOPE_01053 [Fonsecaea pedrosoi]